MTRRLSEFLPSYVEHRIEHSVDPNYFLVGCSATDFNGALIAVTWASDQYLDIDTDTYKAWPPGTTRRPATAEKDKRPAYLMRLSDDFAVVSVEQLVPGTGDADNIRRHGFDGTKPFAWRGELWADLYCNRNPVRFYLARINGRRLDDVHNLAPHSSVSEKNWMPEVIGDALRFHSRPGELVDTNANYTVVESRPDLAHMHGGSQVIQYQDHYNLCGLGIIRDFETDGDALGRKYRHYFIKFAADGRVLDLSQPFIFNREGVEICTGLTYHPDGKRLVISHGAVLATITLDDFRNMKWGGQPLSAPRREHNR